MQYSYSALQIFTRQMPGSIGWDELENPPNDSPTPCFPGMDELMSMQIQDERPTKEQEETLFLRV